MILLVDNYDSFSYNLYQLIGTFQPDIKVIRNDELTVEEIEMQNPQVIILSPGPGKPSEAGRCIEIVQKLGSRIPILGVCLGHQSICEAYGATVSYAKELMHGKQSMTTLDTSCDIFKDLPGEIPVARYHSLAVLEETLPECLNVIGRTTDGEVMAVRHTRYPVYGLQFHPESIMTPQGAEIIKNFLEVAGND
jgi:anthranilate synthase component 2